jgi:uncharacterized protein YndB with AHSA1/START domain
VVAVKTILHVVEIGAAPAEVFRAVATGSGLAGWWTTAVRAQDAVGGVVHLAFTDDFSPHMEITALDEPDLVVWRCVGGHEPWADNTFRFEVSGLDAARSRLVFTQHYARELGDVAYGTYNFNWGYYLQSLKDLVETGSGKPFRPAGR